ncbi:MAG: 30S ribosomal protein S16 [Candidatus Magasanikbacteria bacterium]|nr:30S ribosomal protein S16 [Candidatus Magasanikbacteria bacterium]
MLMVRLQRVGKKKQASYRLIVSDKRRDTQSGALENLGTFDPVVKPSKLVLKKERIQYWLSVGAKPSATVHNILVDAGLVSGKKVRKVRLSAKKRAAAAAKATAAAK